MSSQKKIGEYYTPQICQSSAIFTLILSDFKMICKWYSGILTQAGVAGEHVQDTQAVLPLVPAAFAITPLRHLCAAVTHVVWCHDGTCGGREERGDESQPEKKIPCQLARSPSGRISKQCSLSTPLHFNYVASGCPANSA